MYDGAWTYDGESSNENRVRIKAKATFVSIWVKLLAMQLRGPQLKGKYESRFLVALATPSENRSGLNSLTSRPQSSGSWWINITGKRRWTPAGRVIPANFVFRWIVRLNITAGKEKSVKCTIRSYYFESTQSFKIRLIMSENPKNLFSCAFLPVLVNGQHKHCPKQKYALK
ncbi:alpha/beta-Hydrolases superfamily protein [Striga asiatica]|uniref:Alpha/beta-Hydrolases superfamily protein n=1 Tax=Striga asiatica TaxID=4170 RepID=A0A5A7R8B8_STRAF|nr:alpha/beta-Hydrolases superfamily protein [Striga asiatica]